MFTIELANKSCEREVMVSGLCWCRVQNVHVETTDMKVIETKDKFFIGVLALLPTIPQRKLKVELPFRAALGCLGCAQSAMTRKIE